MWDYLKLAGLGLVAVLAAIAANYAHDLAYQVNAITVMLAAGIAHELNNPIGFVHSNLGTLDG